MPFRLFVVVLGLLLACSALSWAQTSSVDLETLWRTGRFESARALITARRQAGDNGQEFLAQAARAAEEMHDYQLAAELWQAYANTPVNDDAAYLKAKEHAWHCLWLAEGQDPKASWTAVAEAEVTQALHNAGNKTGAAQQLALELEFTLQAIIAGQVTPDALLRKNYPGSSVVLKAAKETLDRIALVSAVKQRMASIKQFLADYPGCYWRHAAYRLWLYTAWQVGDEASLRAAAGSYLAEYPQHPDSYGSVSRYFLDADIERKAGLEHARKSVALYEKQLGTDGSAASLQALDQATRALALQEDWLPAGKRKRFTDYLGSRYNLARYLLVTGDAPGALKTVQPVLESAPFSELEELTLAPFQTVAGQAAEAAGDAGAAYKYYLSALVIGDSRNRSPVMAQSGFNTVAQKLTSSQQAAIAAELVPRELYGVPLPVFADVTNDAGFANTRARRVAWGDVDADGAVDLLLDGSVLLRQAGRGRFEDASQAWGMQRGKQGGIFGDVDNDGDLDLYVFGGGERCDRLLRNDGGKFVDVTAVYGDPTDNAQTEAAVFLDYDNDGWLDLFVVNSPMKVKGAVQEQGAPDLLYRNTGGGKLQLQDSQVLGLIPPFNTNLAGHSAGCVDLNADGCQDIYVGNAMSQENLLWINSNGAFANSARLIGVAGEKTDAGWGNTNGCDWGDYNNDGIWDLFVCNYVNQQLEFGSNRSMLLVGAAGAEGITYTDRTAAVGVRYAPTLMDAIWFDCNNDGWLDLYVTAAYDGRRSYLYLNDGQGGLHDMAFLSRARLLNTWGGAWADYDRDGDLDLLAASPDGVHLLRNDSPGQNWVEIECQGLATAKATPGFSNRSAIGARISVAAEGLQMVREIQSGRGLGCANELVAHFGLGQAGGRISIVVRFPSGKKSARAIIAANQRLVFTEEGEAATVQAPEPDASEDQQPQPQTEDGQGSDAVTRPPTGRTR